MFDRDRLRQAKEDLLTVGLLMSANTALPDKIERSWRRSISQGVTPERTGLVDPVDAERDEQLLTAARPVLGRLAEEIADLCVGVVLGDAQGIIIERFVHDRGQRNQLDRAGACVGSDFAERTLGTNGLGSVIEERAPLFVRGGEHFIDALEGISCAGMPIFDPRTRRVRGSVTLTCTESRTNPMMLTLALTAARDIEQRLMDGRSQGLMDIASAFAEATRRGTGAIALLTPRTVLANTAGLAYVSPANHAAIWDRLVADHIEHSARLQVDLAEGLVDLRAQRVEVADERLAFQVSFAPVRVRGRRAPADPRWHPLRSVHDELVSVSAASSVLVIVGEAGTGKATCGQRMLKAADVSFRDLDLALQDEGSSVWTDAAAEIHGSGTGLLLRHLDALPDSELSRLRDVIGGFAESGRPARLVLTVNRSRASENLLGLVERYAGVVELPGLAGMRSTIPLVVQSIIAQRPRAERCVISAAAMQALSSREWSGNIAELRRVVSGLLAKHPGAMVSREDLPESGYADGRVLSPLERSERATIVQALRETSGNRAEAARILGIGRTTLYRKLRTLRIDDEELAG